MVNASDEGGSIAIGMMVPVIKVVVFSVIPATLHAVVFAYIWSRSRSLAVATVYHAAYDGVRDSLQQTIGSGPLAGTWVTLALVLLGIFLLRKGDWKNLSATAVMTKEQPKE